MNDFDDPGDLGFFNEPEEPPMYEELEQDLFYEPAPGEEDI